MSYARLDGTSDVHVINAGARVECCNCNLGPDFVGSREEMLTHLETHVAAGHRVPAYCTDRLALEAKLGTTSIGETHRRAFGGEEP